MPKVIDYNQHCDACRLVKEVTITAEHIKEYFKVMLVCLIKSFY